jgi:hypothetical protein
LKFWNDDLNHPECELRLLIGDVGKALSPHHGWRKGKRRCPLCARYFECPQQFKTKSKFQARYEQMMESQKKLQDLKSKTEGKKK